MVHPLLHSLQIAGFLSIPSILIVFLIHKSWASAASTYWLAWIFVIYGAYISDINGWIYQDVSSSVCQLINELNYGAFIGFLLGTMICVKKKAKEDFRLHSNLFSKVIWILDNYFHKFFWLSFSLGFLILLEKLLKVGIGPHTFLSLRYLHLTESDGLSIRFANYLYSVQVIAALLIGFSDAYTGIKTKRAFLLILAGAPLSLSKGGRLFIAILLPYLFSLFSVRLKKSVIPNYRILRSDTFKLVNMIVFSVILFSLLGSLKGSQGGDFTAILERLFGWPASSIAALDSWSSKALIAERTYGTFVFEWIAQFLSKFGIVDMSFHQVVASQASSFFERTGDSARFIPSTIIVDLIFDFGREGVFWGMIIIGAFLQFLSLYFSGRGIKGLVISVQSMAAAFNTIQGTVFTGGICVPIIFSFLIEIYLYNLHKSNQKQMSRN